MRETLPPDASLKSTPAQDSTAMEKPRLIRKLLFSATGLAASLAGNAVIFLIIAKSGSATNFGIFAKSYATASLLALIIDFGYQQRILRDAPVYLQKFGGMPARIYHLKAVLTIAASIIAILLAIILHLNLLHFGVIWAGLLMLSFGNVSGVALRAIERHGVDGRNLLIANAISVAYAFTLLMVGVSDITPYAFAFFVSGSIYLLLSTISLRRHMQIVSERFAGGAIYDEFRRGLTYASDGFVIRSYGFVDVLILSFFSGPLGVGIYQLGQKLMQFVLPAAQVIVNVMLPRLSRKTIMDGASIKDLILLTVTIGTFGLAAATAFYLFAGIAIDWFLDPDYAPVKGLIPMFALTIGARIIALAPTLCLIAVGRQRERLAANVLNLAVFIGLCIILSAMDGARGAAIATGISSVILMTLYYLLALVGYTRNKQNM